jgi:hypothetical protein
VQRASSEVDVDPSEPKQLSFAHPGGQGEDVQRLQPVTPDRLKKASRLVWGEGDEVMVGLAWWRDQLGGVAGDKVPAHRVPEGMVQDPVQLQDRGGRESGPHQLAIELVELPRPEPSQSHLADVRNRVEPDELLVPDPGPRANRRLDAAKPGAQELLDRSALVTEDLAVPVRLERDGEFLGDLGSGLAVEELASSLAALPAKVDRGGPAAIRPPIDRALPMPSSLAAHAAASRRSRST